MTTPFPQRNPNPRRPRPSLALGAVVATALLAGCLSATPSPAKGSRALVYGAVGSPIYDELKAKLAVTASDGSQKVSDYDLVIVDGNNFTGEQLGKDRLIRDAVRQGLWVLGLDMAQEDKQGLQPLLHASSRGDVTAYLVRQTFSGPQPVSQMIDLVHPRQDPERAARRIVEFLKRRTPLPQDAPVGPPSRAQTYLWHHTSDYSGPLPQNKAPAFNGQFSSIWPAAPIQNVTWTVDHYITALLDANSNPSGNFQHLVVETSGLADPGPLAQNNIDSCSPSDNCEIAWLQTRFDSSHSVSAGSTPGGTLVLKSTQPTTVNNVQTVTTGTSFNVGYNEAQGVFGSFTYTNTVSHTITDWQVVNASSNTAATWNYASNTIYDGMNTDSFDSGAWSYYFEGVAPKPPNALSLRNLQYDVQSLWENNAVSEDTVTVGGLDSAWYTDAFAADPNYYPYPDDANNCNLYSCYCIVTCQVHQYMARYNNAQPWGMSVDLGVVIPVATESLTLNPNPASAGQTVTATLKLAAPTPIPVEVLITSDKSGITPEHDTYIIPANEDTLTFKVFTGDQGCQPQSATIQAYLADGQNQVLNVTPPPNCG